MEFILFHINGLCHKNEFYENYQTKYTHVHFILRKI